jgi:hypothetical protein
MELRVAPPAAIRRSEGLREEARQRRHDLTRAIQALHQQRQRLQETLEEVRKVRELLR